ncbi:MAG: hypothetical protein EKK61_03360 [Rickettsiales bacterium]|nr:MAG: hypothetical protein EKK61_03360 [Rickettsiales bacterium]
MGKPKKKSAKNKSKNMKKAEVAVISNDAIQQGDSSVETSNNNLKKFDKKFAIIEEKVKEYKDTLFTDNNYLKYCYTVALILKDIETLKLLSVIKPINELLTFDKIHENILHILKSTNDSDEPIKKFLKNIKNVSYGEQILSEDELVAKRKESTKHLPIKLKFQAIKEFDEDYPSLFTKKLDNYTSSAIQRQTKALEDSKDNNHLLGVVFFVKALNTEGEIAAYHYDQAIGYFSTECQKSITKNLNSSINNLICVSKCFRTETSSITNKLLIDLCDKHQTHTKQEMLDLLTVFAQFSYMSGYMADAEITAELAYNIYTNSIQDFSDKKDLSKTLHHLGKIMYHIDYLKGSDYIQIAHKLDPDSEEIKSTMIELDLTIQNSRQYNLSNPHILFNKDNYNQFNVYDVIAKYNSLHFKNSPTNNIIEFYLLLSKSNINQLDVSELVKAFQSIPFEKSITYKVVQIVLDVLQNSNEQALANLCKLLESTKYVQLKIDNLTSILSFITTIKNLDWKLYYDHINDLHKNELNNSEDTGLTYYKFILQINNDLIDEANVSLKNICTKEHSSSLKLLPYYRSQAEEIYISTLIEKRKISKAKEYIENELYTQDLKSKFLLLLNTLEQAEQVHNTESEQESRDIEEITSIIDLADITKVEPDVSDEEETAITDAEIPLSEDKDIFTNLTPQEIHKYFQHLKAQAIKSNPTDKLSKSSEHSWYLENTCIDSKSSQVIKIPNKANFYALIDPKLLATLDFATADQFRTALEKGFASRKIGQNGIKLLGNNLIELKIKGDIRLYTNELYKNPNGDVLIKFSKQGTHKDVTREVKKSYIKTIDVESSAPFDFSKIYNEEFGQECVAPFENLPYEEDLVDTMGADDANN